MHIVHVHVHVKNESVESFIKATLENASNSLREPGIDRFDVIQDAKDKTRFVLCEVYKTPEDALKHKETDHYKTWRDTVSDMMAEPRNGILYTNIFPDDAGWAS
ncbi:MAG: antibiotic biosynthesis monooxygenase [Chloroflexi bacterium]|jgi:quinol monooxygenase YgiN|nr:antibiotic biosynthesis monooxygenase [Chloroflexota bacterium]BCY18591.1 (4S)-4-hydroxy-5-phosphonooxypentane-2,3-dione isomerase [Leptolinea sp. HRD-7]